MRVLYVYTSKVPPPVDQKQDRFLLLSQYLEGDVLQPVWFETPEQVEALFGAGSYPVYTVGRFRYHWFLANAGNRDKPRWKTFWFYLKTGVRVCRERHTDCIVVYSHLTTGLCGVLLKIATRTKLVIEVVTTPETAFLFETPNSGLWGKIRLFYSNVCLYITVLASDRVHLLSAGQLASYPLLRSKPASVFHDYTPISHVAVNTHSDDGRPCILIAGFPWYRKGVDIATEAFRRLSADFPEARLQIVGHEIPRELAAGCPAIEIQNAVPHERMMEIVSHASIMLLPSRNEGMGRILIEGMAAGLPLVGSDVGGIPSLITDGDNGFLFPVGDVPALERCLRKLLADAELRRRMGRRSYERAMAGLTETAYAECFTEMVESVARSGGTVRETRGTD